MRNNQLVLLQSCKSNVNRFVPVEEMYNLLKNNDCEYESNHFAAMALIRPSLIEYNDRLLLISYYDREYVRNRTESLDIIPFVEKCFIKESKTLPPLPESISIDGPLDGFLIETKRMVIEDINLSDPKIVKWMYDRIHGFFRFYDVNIKSTDRSYPDEIEFICFDFPSPVF